MDASSQDAADELQGGQWFLGGYYRHNWIPSFILDPFFVRAPGITNDGFGLLVSHRAEGGFTWELGLGYMPYGFEGAFNADGTLVEDTEYVTSELTMVHATGSLLWPIELHRMLSIELGIGVDLGVFFGNVERSEAYPDAQGRFRACKAKHDPVVTGPDRDGNGDLIEYCAQAFDGNENPIASSPPDKAGEQYGEKEDRVPPLMLFPMLPHLALRFAPLDRVAVKLEFAFSIAQVWAGVSVHVGLGRESRHQEAPEVVAAEPTEPVAVTGRVLGKLMEKDSDLPIAGASIKNPYLFSPIETNGRGLFVVPGLPVGEARFEVSHPEYAATTCVATIGASGGDVPLHCFLVPTQSEGAISGQVKDEAGKPIPGARVEITGPSSAFAVTGAEGLFALPDASVGTYRIRVDADDYFIQLVELAVSPRETSLPQIILIKKPATALVTRKDREIAIKQEVNFAVNSAEINASSDGLLNEIADVLLRNRDVKLIEIQGHTDNKGGRDRNQALSQARAESVREWLVRAGVDRSRLQATGYGQDEPLRPNDTEANRSKNRRVQFIILRQGTP